VNTQIVDSERNLPAAVTASTGATAERFQSRAGAMLARDGLDPSVVAEMVHDAVVEDRFWIITHAGWLDVVADRAAAMRAGTLHRGFGG
jgi:hypothetical protein